MFAIAVGVLVAVAMVLFVLWQKAVAERDEARVESQLMRLCIQTFGELEEIQERKMAQRVRYLRRA